MPCSEYRCQALGKNCEYTEPNGINTGVCVSSSDSSPPGIRHEILHARSPEIEIPPREGVLITLYTDDEDSYCTFRIEGEDKSYETDGEFNRKHEVILTVPGRMPYDLDIPETPAITRDGKFNLLVQCEDARGNVNTDPYKIELVVMDSPDELPPIVSNFSPVSESLIKSGTTTQKIQFSINEPAECRWDFQDVEYDLMGLETLEDGTQSNEKYFICDDLYSTEGMKNGYWCSGILTNITTEIGESTTFYIRCNDQPWLEGKDDPYYSRNVNDKSFEYRLRPSSPLEISEVYPVSGQFVVGGDVKNITYTVRTTDGAERGKAVCKFRLQIGELRTGWKFFDSTNSSNHETTLTATEGGDYIMDILCEDIVGNTANANSSLKIIVDKSPPEMTRIYNNRGSLKLILNEPASCKSIIDKECSALVQNGSLMSNSNGRMEFATSLVKARRYSIRCEDDFGNSRCWNNIIFY